MAKQNFIDLLKQNDSEELSKFIYQNGKKKPYCPFYFDKENESEEGVKEDGRNQSNNE